VHLPRDVRPRHPHADGDLPDPQRLAPGEGDVLGALQSGRRSGLRLLSLLKHEEIIAKARVYAMDIVKHDPTLSAHDGLAALVGQTVGDEERAAWLDRV
jgi:ATP-dependent DNA helicase RecG